MTGLFEIFDPGLRFRREQKDFDKVRRLETVDDCPVDLRLGVDLDHGVARISLPPRPPSTQAAEADAEPDPDSTE